MKAITKTTIALLIFACVASPACGPKVPSRTGPSYSDSTGGSSPDTLQQSARGFNKKKMRKIKPVPTRNDSTGGSSPDTLKIPKRERL